jgi:hypothetical protein
MQQQDPPKEGGSFVAARLAWLRVAFTEENKAKEAAEQTPSWQGAVGDGTKKRKDPIVCGAYRRFSEGVE